MEQTNTLKAKVWTKNGEGVVNHRYLASQVTDQMRYSYAISVLLLVLYRFAFLYILLCLATATTFATSYLALFL